MNTKYNIPDAEISFAERCERAAQVIYGGVLPAAVEERLERELRPITDNGYSTLFEIAAGIAEEVHRLGNHITTRGMISSSFAAWLCGISAVNPLPAHYLCGECCHFELADSENDWRTHGFDLEDKTCPVCGNVMHPDGADIFPEILLGKEFEREPEIFLNVAPDIRQNVIDYLKTQFSDAVLLRAGISKAGKGEKPLESVHPGGIYFVPRDLDVSEVTGLRESGDDGFGLPVTARDFSELYGVFTRCDVYALPSLGLLHDMEMATGVRQADIPMNDNNVLDVFCRDGLDMILPSGANPACGKRAIEIARPVCFSELVQISGLLHGTGTWDEETERLLGGGKRPGELIAYRDDVLRYLIDMGTDRDAAFRIMNSLRKGRGLMETDEQLMNGLGIPEWYTDRCRKVVYLFPKSHGVEATMLSWKLAWYKLHYPDIFAENADRCRY